MGTALITYEAARQGNLLELCKLWWCCPTCTYPPYRVPFKCDNPGCVDNAWHSAEWREVLRERARKHEQDKAEHAARQAMRASLRRQGFTVAF